LPDLLDIIGQGRAIAQLQQAIASSRMPHAFLFTGPDGVGRQSTATALAKILLCCQPTITNRSQLRQAGRLTELAEDFPVKQACGVCPDCKMMDTAGHPDFNLVHKELARYHEDASVRGRVMQELGIDVIDSFLITPAGRSPARQRGKVFVVREADLMSDAAQNSLLKTLEEPPPGVVIILLAEQAQQMLATTVSRCRRVEFGPLPVAFVKDRLVSSGQAAGEADFWAAFTAGSLGRALQLSQQGMYEIKRDMVLRLAGMGGDSAELGEPLAKAMDKLADSALRSAKQTSGVEMSKNLASRQAAGAMIELIASAYLDALHLRTGLAGPIGQPAVVNVDQMQEIQTLSQKFTNRQLAEIIEQLSQYEQLLWRNVNPKIVWDNLVITCSTAAELRI
jgi:DNA polymerase-3 subunit delta'